MREARGKDGLQISGKQARVVWDILPPAVCLGRLRRVRGCMACWERCCRLGLTWLTSLTLGSASKGGAQEALLDSEARSCALISQRSTYLVIVPCISVTIRVAVSLSFSEMLLMCTKQTRLSSVGCSQRSMPCEELSVATPTMKSREPVTSGRATGTPVLFSMKELATQEANCGARQAFWGV